MRRIICAALLAVLLPVVAQRSVAQDAGDSSSAAQARSDLVKQLSSAGRLDKRVAGAFESVPRQRFLPAYLAAMAYQDTSLPLGGGQTLPSPSDLSAAVQALDVRATDSVLVIGADTGYLDAILSRLAAHVFVIETVESERTAIRQIFTALGLTNITVAGDASPTAFAASGPFDRIFIHGATAAVPPAVFAQLASAGKIVIPLRDPTGLQMVVALSRAAGNTSVDVVGKGFYTPIGLGG